MAKVRIEYKGTVLELEEDVVIAIFPGEGYSRAVLKGCTSPEKIVKSISTSVPDILERMSDDKEEYAFAMVELTKALDKKAREILDRLGSEADKETPVYFLDGVEDEILSYIGVERVRAWLLKTKGRKTQ